jgi:hypothetical protein
MYRPKHVATQTFVVNYELPEMSTVSIEFPGRDMHNVPQRLEKNTVDFWVANQNWRD